MIFFFSQSYTNIENLIHAYLIETGHASSPIKIIFSQETNKKFNIQICVTLDDKMIGHFKKLSIMIINFNI